MILVLDNYDSFVYNLVQYLGELGAELEVARNDRLSADDVAALRPRAILISPGPGAPQEAGVCLEVIRHLGPTTPILGICLGHQCIGQAYGGRVGRAPELKHGKSSPILHGGQGLYQGVPSPFQAGRYHSLIVEEAGLPSTLEVTARTPEGLIMGLRHRTQPVEGVQFHPESVLTPEGKRLLENFLDRLAPDGALEAGATGHAREVRAEGHPGQVGTAGAHGGSGRHGRTRAEGHRRQVGAAEHAAEPRAGGGTSQVGAAGHPAEVGAGRRQEVRDDS